MAASILATLYLNNEPSPHYNNPVEMIWSPEEEAAIEVLASLKNTGLIVPPNLQLIPSSPIRSFLSRRWHPYEDEAHPLPQTNNKTGPCDKHSRWKKKCPPSCSLRPENIISSPFSFPISIEQPPLPSASTTLEPTKSSSSIITRNSARKDRDSKESQDTNSCRKDEISLKETVVKKPAPILNTQWTEPDRIDVQDQPDTMGFSLQIGKNQQLSVTPSSRPPPPPVVACSDDDDEDYDNSSEVNDDDDDEYIDMEEEKEAPVCKRASTVCEKHRRWKKRCPPDCANKESMLLAMVPSTSTEKRISASTHKSRNIISKVKKPSSTGRQVGRPAVSCRQHQIEHQKCPDNCPRRKKNQVPSSEEKGARNVVTSKENTKNNKMCNKQAARGGIFADLGLSRRPYVEAK